MWHFLHQNCLLQIFAALYLWISTNLSDSVKQIAKIVEQREKLKQQICTFEQCLYGKCVAKFSDGPKKNNKKIASFGCTVESQGDSGHVFSLTHYLLNANILI